MEKRLYEKPKVLIYESMGCEKIHKNGFLFCLFFTNFLKIEKSTDNSFKNLLLLDLVKVFAVYICNNWE